MSFSIDILKDTLAEIEMYQFVDKTKIPQKEYEEKVADLKKTIKALEANNFNDFIHSVSVPLPDHYVGKLNTERIKAYRFEAEKYYIEEGTVGKIFCAGANWYKSKCNER